MFKGPELKISFTYWNKYTRWPKYEWAITLIVKHRARSDSYAVNLLDKYIYIKNIVNTYEYYCQSKLVWPTYKKHLQPFYSIYTHLIPTFYWLMLIKKNAISKSIIFIFTGYINHSSDAKPKIDQFETGEVIDYF